jgi:HSP20 family protein
MDLIPWRRKGQRAAGETPGRPLTHFRDEVESVMERFFRDPWTAGLTAPFERMLGSYPQLDITESDQHVTVQVELPGVDPQDVQIELRGNALALSGEKRDVHDETRGGQQYSERRYGRFSRTIPLPSGIDPDQVDAAYKDGVLTITLAKSPAAQPQQIPVRNA